ncbi:MAG: hypothetical protein HOE83_00080 [Alphaproteobacteria bacterium]|jgi:hypothetical protein|nr:hypothetical protein [Alphaproteobacteria bacterium]
MTEIKMGHESPAIIRKSLEYAEGFAACLQRVSITQNPYIGVEPSRKGWYWSHGWHDALQNKVMDI